MTLCYSVTLGRAKVDSLFLISAGALLPTPASTFIIAFKREHEYIIEREGEYPTSLCTVTTLCRGHDLCNDIHRLEALVLAVCGHVHVHVAKPHVL